MKEAAFPSIWSEEIIFNEGDAFYRDLLDAVSKAKKTIRIETYIFDLDVQGLKVLEALSAAATRGISVKLLLDGAGCSEWEFEDAEKFRKENLEIQFFHPLLWQRKYSRLWTYFNLGKVIRGMSLMNHRNHRKVFLVDDTAYVGSMNISARHSETLMKESAWRDTVVKIKGDCIQVLYESFNEAWTYYNNYLLRYLHQKNNTSGFPLLMLNRTVSQRRKSYHSLIQRILNAKQRILITNPYFIPTQRLRKTLKEVVKKGVEVIAIFPSKSDFIGVQLAMEGGYESLLKSGVQIYQYQPAMLHAKVLITDDRVMIGSSNMNSRSLFLDLEVDVEITHPENRKLAIHQFETDLSRSKKITIEDWSKRSTARKILEKIFFWFRMIL